MEESFFDNLTAVTSNIEEIIFSKYAVITEVNDDNTVNCREDETDTTHTNVSCINHINKVGDTVLLGFVDNSVYNPVVLGNISHNLLETVAMKEHKHNILNITYPVGSVYSTINEETDPNIVFGGVWSLNNEENNIYTWIRTE